MCADLSEDGELAGEDSNLFLVRNKRDLSPSGSQDDDQPDAKKHKVSFVSPIVCQVAIEG